MKKILLSASLLLAGMMTSYAQVPDASQWTKGQEITEAVNFGNPSFENDPFDYWQLESSKGSFTKTGASLFEVFDGADVDLYQYVQLPAGMYRVECQGYYRNGESWAYDPNSYANQFMNGTGTEEWTNNALLYVQNGAYDITSEEFTPARTFKCPLMPRLFPEQYEQLYEDMDYHMEGEEKKYDAGWNRSDGQYTQCGGRWAPCSIPGTQVWFGKGFYMPYVDEDYEDTKIKYNTTSFFVSEAGYVKIGVSKIAARGADSFIVTNFKLYYDGEVDPETAELLALQEEVQEYYDKAKKLESKYTEGMIYSLINDAISEFEDEYGTPSDLESEDDCAAAKLALISLINEIEAAEKAYAQLQTLVPAAKNLYETTEYPGKAAYGTIIQAAENCLDPNYEMEGGETFDFFQDALDNLIAGRLDYLMTQEKVNGAIDLSIMIANRFFTNEANNPVWNPETNFWEYSQDLKDANPEFFNAMEFNGEDATMKAQRAVISGEVVLSSSDNTKPFQWYKTGSGGPGWDVYYDHKMTSCKSWAPTPTSGVSVIGQYLKGLPNGFYSLTGMAEAWTNEGVNESDNHFIIRTNETSARSERAEPRAWWNGNTKDSWNTLSTGMVEVKDGDLWVEASVNGFYSITGFQLFYYGETPDFAALLQPMIDKAKENIEDNLVWQGDIAKASALLDAIDLTKVTDGDSYKAAQEAIDAANEYVATASAVVKNFKGADNFAALGEKYDEGTPEADILALAWMETLAIGDGDNDTYELAIQNDKDYAAYAHYFDFRSAMGNLASDAGVAAVLSDQNTYLSANFVHDDEMADLEKALALPYNKALLESLGAANASEKNPVDITALLINPAFDEGAKGWTGNPTVTSGEALPEELGAAEMWNVNFDVNQIIYALPAGFYKVECQALYRDAGDAKDAFTNWEYNAGGSFEDWENKNAKLYANDNDTTIVSIASEMFTERSMTAYQNKTVKLEEGDEQGNDVYAPAWRIMCTEKEGDNFVLPAVLPADAPQGLAPEQYIVSGVTDWWWDTEIEDMEQFYYYPASLMGATRRFKNSPNAYKNEVVTKVEEGGSLKLGIKKEVQVTNDWVVFDNFKLYYLGSEAPTGINAAAAEKAAVEGIFSLDGVQQSELQKGVNIVKKANGEVKKIFKD